MDHLDVIWPYLSLECKYAIIRVNEYWMRLEEEENSASNMRIDQMLSRIRWRVRPVWHSSVHATLQIEVEFTDGRRVLMSVLEVRDWPETLDKAPA